MKRVITKKAGLSTQKRLSGKDLLKKAMVKMSKKPSKKNEKEDNDD